jgi:hypothetical protein
MQVQWASLTLCKESVTALLLYSIPKQDVSVEIPFYENTGLLSAGGDLKPGSTIVHWMALSVLECPAAMRCVGRLVNTTIF